MLKQISRYEIKKEIGRGGMAVVYLGHDPQFNRPVAIKVLPKQLMFDSSFRSRFKREAEVIASLEHAAIVPVYDYGEEDEQPYLVMRYMPGGSLRDRIKKGKLSLEESATLLKRIAPALDKAHRRGIVHRDIKPENILFDEEGEAYISDFGIAKITENSTGLTGSAIIGTPAYMSPEQALGKNQVDGRSDLYSLGVTLFEALAGQELFKADTPMGLAMAHINEAPQSITSRRKDLPVAIDAILDKVLSKKPSERYASAKEFAEGFAGVSNSKTIGQAKAAPKTVALPKKRRSKQTQATGTYQQGRSIARKTNSAGHKQKWYENTAVWFWFAAAALLILFLYRVWPNQPDAGTNTGVLGTTLPTSQQPPITTPNIAATSNLVATRTARVAISTERVLNIHSLLEMVGYSSKIGELFFIDFGRTFRTTCSVAKTDDATLCPRDLSISSVKNFILGFDVTWTSDSENAGCGILFFRNPDVSNFQYYFQTTRLNGAPTWGVYRETIGFFDTNPDTNAINLAINQSSGSTNQYILVVDKQAAAVYGNGSSLGNILLNPEPTEGSLELTAWSEEGQVVCDFNNIWIWKLP